MVQRLGEIQPLNWEQHFACFDDFQLQFPGGDLAEFLLELLDVLDWEAYGYGDVSSEGFVQDFPLKVVDEDAHARQHVVGQRQHRHMDLLPARPSNGIDHQSG